MVRAFAEQGGFAPGDDGSLNELDAAIEAAQQDQAQAEPQQSWQQLYPVGFVDPADKWWPNRQQTSAEQPGAEDIS